MKRIIISIPIIFFTGIVLFYFWASSGTIEQSLLNSKITYHENYRKSNDTLTVMTYNIGYLSGMTNNLAVYRDAQLFEVNLLKANDLMRQLQPDIVGLQEIDFNSERSYGVNQMERTSHSCDFANAYRSVNWDKTYVPFPYWPPSGHFGQMLSGQAVLSNYEIIAEETITLSKPVNTSFVYNHFYLDRLVQVAKIKIGERNLILMNVHLEAFDQETRVMQASVVKELFEKYALNYPVLLIGDFNSEPEYLSNSDGMAKVMQAPGIESAINEEKYRMTDSNTFPSGQPDRMIDYILYNSQWIRKIEARVISNAGEMSDHLPVIMKFVFQ